MTIDLPSIISRDEARALGLKRFFTGKPCKRGHVAERWACGGGGGECVECSLENGRKYRAADPERAREKWRKWRTAKLQRDRAADPVQEYRRAQWAAQRAAKLQKDPQVAKREARRLWWAAKRAAERNAARARAELNRGAGLTGAS